MSDLPIIGRRTRLRDMTLEDLPRWEHWMMPGHRWHELDGPYYPKPSIDDVVNMVASAREKIEAADWPEPRRRLIVADAESDRLGGQVSWYWESQETTWLSVGIVLFDPDMWGRGLGYEALGLWCEYLLDAMPDLARLDLRTWSGNHGMVALAHKLGFLEEARFRKARIVDGEYYDGLGYGVLREEWIERYPSGFAASLS